MIEWSLRRPVTIVMICLSLLVLGILSFQKIPLQLLPEFEVPKLRIMTSLRGATAREIEASVTDPLERALSTVPSIKEIKSQSERDRSEIEIEFFQHAKMKEILPIVKERLDLTALPDGATKPFIKQGGPNRGALISFIVPLPAKSDEQMRFVEILRNELVQELERIDGVALAQVSGTPHEEIEISVNKEALIGRGITFQNIFEQIQERTQWIPLGEVSEQGQAMNLRLGNPLKNEEDLKGLPIVKSGGRSLRLQDIAAVQKILSPPEQPVYRNGAPALLVDVFRNSEANAVNVGQKVRARILSYFSSHKEIQYEVLVDQSAEIENAVSNIESTVLSGGIMASVVIYILVQVFWSSLVVSLTIPLSLLVTLIMMNAFGVSFNIMSLAGLALGVGMLVDNSTVVLESVMGARKKLRDPFQAALFGATRVAGAVTGSTLSTLAVFAPLLFVAGPIGFYFRDVAKTVSFSMLASLFVSLIMIPLLAIKEPGQPLSPQRDLQFPRISKESLLRPLELFLFYFELSGWFLAQLFRTVSYLKSWFFFISVQSVTRFQSQYLAPKLIWIEIKFEQIEKSLLKQIQFFKTAPKTTLSGLAVVILLGSGLIGMRGTELFPDEAIDRITYDLEVPSLLTEDSMEKIRMQILDALKEIKEVKSTVFQNRIRGRYRSRLIVTCEPRKLNLLAKKIQDTLSKIDHLQFERKPQALVEQGPPIVLEIKGDDDAKVADSAKWVADRLAQLPQLSEVQNLDRPAQMEFRLRLNTQKISQYSVDPSRFSQTLRDILTPKPLGVFEFGSSSMRLGLRADSGIFTGLEYLMQISVDSDDQKKVYLQEVSAPEKLTSPSIILRKDRARYVPVQAFLNGSSLQAAAARVETAVGPELKKRGLTYEITGQNEARKENVRQLSYAFLFSILIIFVLLASQFEDLRQPFVILFAVPFCSIGVGVMLWLFGLNVSATVMVGFILLVGTSVNTSIVMVDLANQLRAEGKSPAEAIVEATLTRVRPILVTTASNILGLVPMLFTGSEPGGSMQLPLAVTIIGGLVSSTWITLVALPSIYVLLTKDKDVSAIFPT